MGAENVTPQMICAVTFMVIAVMSFFVFLIVFVPYLSDYLDDMREIRQIRIKMLRGDGEV